MKVSNFIVNRNLTPHPEGLSYADAGRAPVPPGGWVLVGRTVSPEFQFDTFGLARPDWSPED